MSTKNIVTLGLVMIAAVYVGGHVLPAMIPVKR